MVKDGNDDESTNDEGDSEDLSMVEALVDNGKDDERKDDSYLMSDYELLRNAVNGCLSEVLVSAHGILDDQFYGNLLGGQLSLANF